MLDENNQVPSPTTHVSNSPPQTVQFIYPTTSAGIPAQAISGHFPNALPTSATAAGIAHFEEIDLKKDPRTQIPTITSFSSLNQANIRIISTPSTIERQNTAVSSQGVPLPPSLRSGWMKQSEVQQLHHYHYPQNQHQHQDNLQQGLLVNDSPQKKRVSNSSGLSSQSLASMPPLIAQTTSPLFRRSNNSKVTLSNIVNSGSNNNNNKNNSNINTTTNLSRPPGTAPSGSVANATATAASTQIGVLPTAAQTTGFALQQSRSQRILRLSQTELLPADMNNIILVPDKFIGTQTYHSYNSNNQNTSHSNIGNTHNSTATMMMMSRTMAQEMYYMNPKKQSNQRLQQQFTKQQISHEQQQHLLRKNDKTYNGVMHSSSSYNSLPSQSSLSRSTIFQITKPTQQSNNKSHQPSRMKVSNIASSRASNRNSATSSNNSSRLFKYLPESNQVVLADSPQRKTTQAFPISLQAPQVNIENSKFNSLTSQQQNFLSRSINAFSTSIQERTTPGGAAAAAAAAAALKSTKFILNTSPSANTLNCPSNNNYNNNSKSSLRVRNPQLSGKDLQPRNGSPARHIQFEDTSTSNLNQSVLYLENNQTNEQNRDFEEQKQAEDMYFVDSQQQQQQLLYDSTSSPAVVSPDDERKTINNVRKSPSGKQRGQSDERHVSSTAAAITIQNMQMNIMTTGTVTAPRSIEEELHKQRVEEQRSYSNSVAKLISSIQNNAMENIQDASRLQQSKEYRLAEKKSKVLLESSANKTRQFQENLRQAKQRNHFQGLTISMLEEEFATGGQFNQKNYNNLKINRSLKRTKQQVIQIFKNTIRLLQRLNIDPAEAMTTKIFSSKPFEKENSYELFKNIKANQTDQVSFMLKYSKYLVHDYDFLFMTGLHWACKRGFYKMAEILISYNSDIDAEDIIGRTPLYFAIEQGFEDIIELLLYNRASPYKTKYVDYASMAKSYVVQKMLAICRRLHWTIKLNSNQNKAELWRKEINVIFLVRAQQQIKEDEISRKALL